MCSTWLEARHYNGPIAPERVGKTFAFPSFSVWPLWFLMHMYVPESTLHITLLPADGALQNCLASAFTPDAGAHAGVQQLAFDSLTQLPEQLPQGAVHTHIAFIRPQPQQGWMRRLRQFFPGALVVLMATPEEIGALHEGLDAQDMAGIDDVWLSTASAAEVTLRFRALTDRHVRHQRNYFYDKALHAAINNLPFLVWFKNAQRTHLKVNDAFCECVGKEKSNVEGYDHWHIWGITREEYEQSEYVCVDTDDVIIKNHAPGAFDETVKSVRGMRHFRAYKAPFYDAADRLLGTVGIAEDVTDLRNIDIRFKVVLNNMPFATLFSDEEGRTLHINTRFIDMFQVEEKKLLGSKLQIGDVINILEEKPSPRGEETEIRAIMPSGKVAQLVRQQIPIFDVFENLVANLDIYIDVTRSRELDRRLKEMAFTDALTGLSTRHYLFQQIDQVAPGQGIALLSMDLDNFKRVNDQFGHGAGDDLLKLVGETIRSVFLDDLCVRLGGDEFLVVRIGNQPLVDFVAQVEVLRERLQQRCAKREKFRLVGMSGGIAYTADVGRKDFDFDVLLDESDRVLYHAKEAGKGCTMVSDGAGNSCPAVNFLRARGAC